MFGSFFSSKTPAKEQDLLEVAILSLERIKSDKRADDEIEKEAKAKEMKMLERKAKLASISREMESTYDSIEAGRKRVKKIEQRIAALEREEQDNLQDFFEKSVARRKQLEASLWEEEEETPPAPSPTAPAPSRTAPVPGVPKHSVITERGDNPNIK